MYQYMEEKGVYPVNNKVSEVLEEDLPDSKTYYTNELYNKLQANFMGIELVCDRCTSIFPS